MLVLFVILLTALKGISVLNTRLIAFLAQQQEKSPKLVAIHKKESAFTNQQIA